MSSNKISKQKQAGELVSVIIPAYNEQKSIGDCIKSLKSQNYKNLEIITVDDGSKDDTVEILKSLSVRVFNQKHKGPGSARNFGAGKAKGTILVFVDADMIFSKDFIGDLIKPILGKKAIGTFSKNEYVKNFDNIWSVCWNIQRNAPKEKMLPDSYPDTAPVYRAILKKEFDSVGGFDTSGQYTDDWSLARKLNKQSALAPGAVYYHSNPASIREVWVQALWIGKSEFLSGSFFRRIKSIILYSPVVSLFIAAFKATKFRNSNFFLFKLVYDFAILKSVLVSFFPNVKKHK